MNIICPHCASPIALYYTSTHTRGDCSQCGYKAEYPRVSSNGWVHPYATPEGELDPAPDWNPTHLKPQDSGVPTVLLSTPTQVEDWHTHPGVIRATCPREQVPPRELTQQGLEYLASIRDQIVQEEGQYGLHIQTLNDALPYRRSAARVLSDLKRSEDKYKDTAS